MAKPKRILYFMNDLFGGGAQKGLINLLDADFFRGAELHVATIIRGDGCVEPDLRRHLAPGNLHIFSSAERMKLSHLLKALLLYPILLLRLRPSSVVLSLPQASLVGRFWGHLLPISKLFAFEHSISYAKKAYAVLLKALSLSISAILIDTQRTGSATRRFFLPFKRYEIIELPLYTGSVAPAHLKTSTRLAKPVRLLIAGRLTVQKNHAALFSALKILLGQGQPVHLTVVGNGELEAQLKVLVTTLGIAPNVTFLGYLTPWTIQCPLADIYIQPSLREGLCITVVEAMRHGLPTIASPRGGMLDYGVDGENILYTDPENPADIATQITRLIKGNALREKLATNAVSSMENLFGTAATRKKLNAARAAFGLN